VVAGPAGYSARDFWRTGWPLTLVYLVVTVGMVNLTMWLLPFA